MGKRAIRLLPNEALSGVKMHGLRVCICWALSKKRTVGSGLCLDAEQRCSGVKMHALGFLQVGLCGRRACRKRESGLSLAAEQRLNGVKMLGFGVCTIWTLWKKGMFKAGKLAFPCCSTKIEWGQDAWIWDLCKLDFVEEGHVRSLQVGFPLLRNKAWSGVKMPWFRVCICGTLWKKGMFKAGKWVFPCW